MALKPKAFFFSPSTTFNSSFFWICCVTLLCHLRIVIKEIPSINQAEDGSAPFATPARGKLVSAFHQRGAVWRIRRLETIRNLWKNPCIDCIDAGPQ